MLTRIKEHGLGENNTLKCNHVDNGFVGGGLVVLKKIFREILCYVEKLAPSLDNQQLVADHLLTEIPKEINYVKRTVFRRPVGSRGIWTFALGLENGQSVPPWVFVGFMTTKKIKKMNHKCMIIPF